MMVYQTIPVTAFAQNCSLVWCAESGQGIIVDPGGDAEKIQAVVTEKSVTVTQILLTHGHLDHVGAAAALAALYGVPIIGPHRNDAFWLEGLPEQSRMFGLPECAPLQPDRWLEEGDCIKAGSLSFDVLLCPGHTPGHVVFFEPHQKLLISGDVIFSGGVGRTDFPMGSHSDLIASITDKLLPLGDDVTFLPGHGSSSTLGQERIANPFLQ